MKNVLILTALPFKRQGNQSLIRFVTLFLQRGFVVEMYSSGSDARGHNDLATEGFTLRKAAAVRDRVFAAARALRSRLPRPEPTRRAAPATNYYATIRSNQVVPPYGSHGMRTFLVKWAYFLLLLCDNALLVLYFALFNRAAVQRADVVIGYECDYAIAASLLSKAFRKKYINKYQGTALKATGRDLVAARLFYPGSYFGLNRADLCLMVDDGTDGEYYARARGNRSIFFEPHGVAVGDYPDPSGLEAEFRDRILFFNNASASKWKRVDRVLRAIARLPAAVRAKIVFATTYHAEDVAELKRFSHDLGLDDCVRFVDRLNHVQSNAMLRRSRALVMTNEMSNLGNPVLEALHYGVPVVSIDDGSLDGYVDHGVNGILIALDDRFDASLADAMARLSEDEAFHAGLRGRSASKVHALDHQQEKEFLAISACLGLACGRVGAPCGRP